MRGQGRFSIPTRIFLGFVFVLGIFSALSIASILAHQRTAQTLRRIHEGYLPLALTIGELRATQSVFSTLLDRVLDETDSSATRSWLTIARRVRVASLRHAIKSVTAVEALQPPAGERQVLGDVRGSLSRAADLYGSDQASFDALFSALSRGDRAGAETSLASLRSRELETERALRTAFARLQTGIQDTSASAEKEERQTVLLLAGLLICALAVGTAITVFSRRILAPLRALQERVIAIARGEPKRKLEPVRDDEIGRLTLEFERMVEALDARDARLREASARLVQTERLAAIGRMAAHVTHEVRNPLSSIGLNVELLEDELASQSPETRALFLAIRREIDRLTQITEEYLRVARLPPPRFEREDIAVVVDQVARFVGPEMEAARVRLIADIAPALPAVSIDETQIRQALLNLLRNAREAMPEGGTCSLSVRAEQGRVLIAVADTGVGIPEEARAHMLELFFTTKERGTGLGLPLSNQVVMAHGGTLSFDSTPLRGTTFTLSLPALPPDPDAA